MNANPTYPNVDVSEFPSQNPFFNFYGYNPFYHNFSQTKQFSLILNGLRTLLLSPPPPQKKKRMGYAFFYNYRKTYQFNLLLYFID